MDVTDPLEDHTLPLERVLRDCVEGGIALMGDWLELLQNVGEAGAVYLRYVLYGEEQRAAREGRAGLRDGDAEEFRGRDAADDVAIGVVDGDG